MNATSKKTDKVTVSKKRYQSVQDVKTVPIIKFIDQVIKDIKELKAHTEQKISQPNQVHSEVGGRPSKQRNSHSSVPKSTGKRGLLP